MAKIIKTTFKLKRGTAAKWLENNPILAEGEPGFELDTNKLKIGDGITSWRNLPYIVDVDLEEFKYSPITFEKIKTLFQEENKNGI